MAESVRPIQERIEDILVLDIEALCDFADNLQYHIPDSLSESKLHATHSSILKESTNGLVIGEASCRREQIVLHGRNSSHGNLRGEVAHLVLSQTEVSLTFLKDDFQRPALGVDSVGLEEVYLAVGGDESVPFSHLLRLQKNRRTLRPAKTTSTVMCQHPRRRLYLRPFLGWSKRVTSWLAVYSLPLYMYFVLPILIIPR